mgnify:CR=1 FL=1
MKPFLLVLGLFWTVQICAQTYTGKASFYSDKLHGRETASGEKYDMYAHTAAHLTLPFGTKVRVTNLWNGKNVVVTINDRGPFAEGRIIDLSKQAAIDLQMVVAGIVDAKVEVLHPDSVPEVAEPKVAQEHSHKADKDEAGTPPTKVRGDGTFKMDVRQVNELTGYGVQIGSYSDYLALMKKVEELNSKGFPDIYVNTAMVKGTRYFRIIVGNFERKEDADLYLLSLKSKGFEGFLTTHQVKQ